jgi:hypothetical protein
MKPNSFNINSMHSFSRIIAERYGVNAAIVLAYLGHKIKRSHQMHDGRQWYFDTLDNLHKVYPYMSRTTVFEAIKRLTGKNGPLIAGNYNKKGYDRTKWYAFRNEGTSDSLTEKPLYYLVEDAVNYGVTKAVLLANLRYWIEENQRTMPGYRFHPVSALDLSEHLPFSRSTIQRALTDLVEVDGELISVKDLDKRNPSKYAFNDGVELVVKLNITETCAKANESIGIECVPRKCNMGVANPDLCASNENTGGSFTNMRDANPNNNTILIDSSFKDSHLKDDSLKDTINKSAPVLRPGAEPSFDIFGSDINWKGDEGAQFIRRIDCSLNPIIKQDNIFTDCSLRNDSSASSIMASGTDREQFDSCSQSVDDVAVPVSSSTTHRSLPVSQFNHQDQI